MGPPDRSARSRAVSHSLPYLLHAEYHIFTKTGPASVAPEKGAGGGAVKARVGVSVASAYQLISS